MSTVTAGLPLQRQDLPGDWNVQDEGTERKTHTNCRFVRKRKREGRGGKMSAYKQKPVKS